MSRTTCSLFQQSGGPNFPNSPCLSSNLSSLRYFQRLLLTNFNFKKKLSLWILENRILENFEENFMISNFLSTYNYLQFFCGGLIAVKSIAHPFYELIMHLPEKCSRTFNQRINNMRFQSEISSPARTKITSSGLKNKLSRVCFSQGFSKLGA